MFILGTRYFSLGVPRHVFGVRYAVSVYTRHWCGRRGDSAGAEFSTQQATITCTTCPGSFNIQMLFTALLSWPPSGETWILRFFWDQRQLSFCIVDIFCEVLIWSRFELRGVYCACCVETQLKGLSPPLSTQDAWCVTAWKMAISSIICFCMLLLHCVWTPSLLGNNCFHYLRCVTLYTRSVWAGRQETQDSEPCLCHNSVRSRDVLPEMTIKQKQQTAKLKTQRWNAINLFVN